jgi:pyruvate dehydrogenase E2 component (dihydrolipoamide acetyltransferase)
LSDRNYGRLRISPAAKTLAVKQGVDITTVERSGPAGRIVRRDIERAVAEQPKPMSRLRQVIARRMAQSFSTVPHYFVTVRADMTDLATLARKAKAGGTACSLTDFIMKATVLALQEFPAVNSTTDGHTVRWHSRVHLGLAVAIEEGLVVPVIRNAEDLSLGDLRQAARTLTARARERTLRPEEMTGSTFTISNMGMLDVDDFTAIINPGESAILAVATARETPCVVNGRVKVRTLMNMTLSADHRIVDGAVAARFVNAIKTTLEDIRLWKRMI